MKAIVYHSYGSADVLKLEEIQQPIPKDDQVLIKVRAAALNPLDWRMMKGVPLPFRIMMKMATPTAERAVGVGRDVAGVIQTVGKSVTQFKVGDEVFGTCEAAAAEYACAKETGLVKKPAEITFEQAASIPVAGLTALQGLRDKGKVQAGQRVLVNGAAGGVGTFAVQVAKSLGAEVTGVCSGANVEMVLSIGADKVIDYTQEDFTKGTERYDVILECVGNKPFSECRPVLKPEGRYIIVGGGHDITMIGIMASALKTVAQSSVSRQKAVMFIARSNQQDLTFLGELIATGKVRPVIDRTCKLDETPDAVAYLERGHARGKVVIDVAG
ncbi:MAG TPA: NAD(P)-dependent alcohol dehydrogenase [Pyrinomonadaceae bacterium]|nr:NAD(P)-dependent alcohol dehydrogenase [Pyrinomonadaceae bacterium]